MPARARIFLDANVIFSGLYSPSGPCAAILRAHIAGDVHVVVSRQVLDEVIRTLKRKQSALLGRFYVVLEQFPFEVQPDPPASAVDRLAVLISPPDAPILAAAIAADVDALVTGNTRHFTPKVAAKSGLRIVTPAQFVAETLRPPT